MDDFWPRLFQAIMEELDRSGEATSCVMAASVLLRVLHMKGIKGAYPLTVEAMILNPELTIRYRREPRRSPPELLKECSSEGCAMVLIGHGEGTSNEWAGHLVVVIPEARHGRDALFDLTITQVNKPEWDIQIGSVLVGVNESFIKGIDLLGVTMNGCRILYKAFPNDDSFKQTPVWQRRLKRDLLAKRVLKSL